MSETTSGKPIVKLKSSQLRSSKPFRCTERAPKHPHLYVIIFTIMSKIAELSDAYCVYASKCSYDDLVSFLHDAPMVTEVSTDLLLVVHCLPSPARFLKCVCSFH